MSHEEPPDHPDPIRASGPVTPLRIGDLLVEGRRRLSSMASAPSSREAALLLGHVLGLDEVRLRARDDQWVEAVDVERFRQLLDRRETGEPVAYLRGHREFWGRDFLVDPRVLIPRPETEHLIEVVLDLGLPPAPRLLDVGSGSGCIAVTLAVELTGARAVATDRSPGALAVTSANARRFDVADRLVGVCTDLADGIDLGSIDLLVSNPPYIDPSVAETLAADVVDHEPSLALFAAERGTAILTALLDRARALRPGVFVVVEIGYDQGEWLLAAASERSWLEVVELRRDYAGHPRVGVLRRSRST
ncbi:MAG: peptide chain release factor N(5)-glutamine methyltransferase [Acidobacteriota bacterium]